MPTPAVPTAAIREWAREQGLDVAERGRLKPEVLDAYRAAHRRTKAKATPVKRVPAAEPESAAAARKPDAPRSAAATTTATPVHVHDGAEAAQDHRLTTLEAAMEALTARVAKLEAATAAPAAKKRFSRKARSDV
jgi:hypothetical protein